MIRKLFSDSETAVLVLITFIIILYFAITELGGKSYAQVYALNDRNTNQNGVDIVSRYSASDDEIDGIWDVIILAIWLARRTILKHWKGFHLAVIVITIAMMILLKITENELMDLYTLLYLILVLEYFMSTRTVMKCSINKTAQIICGYNFIINKVHIRVIAISLLVICFWESIK